MSFVVAGGGKRGVVDFDMYSVDTEYKVVYIREVYEGGEVRRTPCDCSTLFVHRRKMCERRSNNNNARATINVDGIH